MLKIILISISFLLVSSVFAQPGEVPVEEVGGKKYHVHTVKKGQTAYGISKMYNVSINDLYEVNPEAEKGLSIGQRLLFPVKGETLQGETNPKVEGDKIIHIVQQGETLYSIARKYGVPANDVIEVNKQENLAIGSEVIVPLKNVTKDDESDPIIREVVNPVAQNGDSIVLHKVKSGETLYALSKQYNVSEEAIRKANDGLPEGLQKGMKLRIPIKKIVIESDQLETEFSNDSLPVQVDVSFDSTSVIKENYSIAVMVPFFFEENRQARLKCPPIGDCPVYSNTLRALDFHHGVLMAVDSLKKAGMNVIVNVYDTKNDTAIVNDILNHPDFAKNDLIIGPFYARQIKIVADYARENHIQLICPVPVSNKALFNNPYVTKLIASTPTQIESLARYVATNHYDDNVILVRNNKDEKDEYNFRTFKKVYNEEIKKYANRYNDSILESYVNDKGSRLSAIEAKMKGDTNNVIVVPSESIGHVSTFFTKLSSTSNSNPYRTYPISIFGTEDWMNFETIDEKYKNKYNLKMVTSGYVDYSDSLVVDFIKKYRSEFSTDPSNYSFIGFDATFNMLKGLYLYGTQFTNHYPHLQNKGYFSDVNFEKVDDNSGFENKKVIIIEHTDYHVNKIRE